MHMGRLETVGRTDQGSNTIVHSAPRRKDTGKHMISLSSRSTDPGDSTRLGSTRTTHLDTSGCIQTRPRKTHLVRNIQIQPPRSHRRRSRPGTALHTVWCRGSVADLRVIAEAGITKSLRSAAVHILRCARIMATGFLGEAAERRTLIDDAVPTGQHWGESVTHGL
jgi:hypothetical protein